jgi:hypothetical protein
MATASINELWALWLIPDRCHLRISPADLHFRRRATTPVDRHDEVFVSEPPIAAASFPSPLAASSVDLSSLTRLAGIFTSLVDGTQEALASFANGY